MVRIIFYFLLIFFLSIIASCSKFMHPPAIHEPVFYPPPPDSVRIQFLTGYSNSLDITGMQSKFKTFVAGPEKVFPIIKPYGLAINKGRIFIADPGIAGLQIIDLESNSFDIFKPGGRGFLRMPINCFVDSKGDLYITDLGRKQVIIYDKDYKYIGEIGGDENYSPTDVFVKGDTILVTDSKNNRINAYSKIDFQLMFSFPEAKIGEESWLYNPLNLTMSGDNLYITDFGDFRIKSFNKEYDFIRSVGSYGQGPGLFVRPKGIAVDRDENLYVVDAGFENVQIFNKKGQALMFFGGAYQGHHGDMTLPAKVTIDYENLRYYEKYVDPAYDLLYLIFVTNQYGPVKVNVYGRVIPKTVESE